MFLSQRGVLYRRFRLFSGKKFIYLLRKQSGMFKRGSASIRHIAIFLIYLIIIPVLHTANVFAEFNAEITGYDNINGFRRSSNDVTKINITASLPDETITPTQIKLISDPTRPFDCSSGEKSEQVYCEMIIPGDLPPGPTLYEVQLFHENFMPVDDKTELNIYSDGAPPTINSFELTRQGKDINISFIVTDALCNDCSPTVCAGITKVEFTLDYATVGRFLPSETSCFINNASSISIEQDKGTTSNKTLCVFAYDRVQQYSSKCQSIVADFSSPEIINASMLIGDKLLKYTKGEPISGIAIEVYVREPSGLNVSTIVANLSSINKKKEFSETYEKIDMSDFNKLQFGISCENISEEIYRCEWNNLLAIFPPESSPKIAISASDIFGNTMNSEVTLPIIFDNTKPAITGFRSGIADDLGKYWVGKGNNTIFVDITETGVGLNEKRVFVDFSSFGNQQYAGDKTILVPNNCTEGWTCTFEWINVITFHKSGDILAVNVKDGSSDDAGNLVEGTTISGFYYDDEPPQIINVQKSSDCPTSVETLELTINVSEKFSGDVKVIFSAPGISTAFFPQTSSCEKTEKFGVWTCIVEIGGLVSYYVDGNVNLTLIDRAGNRNTTTIQQEVCEALPGTPPNVIGSSANGMPDPLDKIIAGYIAYPAFAEVNLHYVTPINVQDIHVISCSSDLAEVSDPYLATPKEMKTPIIGFKLALDRDLVADKDKLNVNCSLDLIVRAGTKVYTLPEKETVNIEFGLAGSIFGGLNASSYKKLLDVEKEINETQKEIDDYSTARKVFETICTIAEILAMLVSLLQVIKIVLYVVAWIISGVVAVFSGKSGGFTAGSALYYPACWIVDYITAIVITTAWQIDMLIPTAFLSLGFYLKLVCAYVTCRFTETNNFIEMFGDTGSANGGSSTFSRANNTKEGKPNSLGKGGFVDYQISAYKGIGFAQYCFPAIKYNTMKKKQILCMKRDCYKQMVSSGFSPEFCDEMYKVQECLYYYSAAWTLVGQSNTGNAWKGIFEWLSTQFVSTGASLGLRALACGYPTSYYNLATGLAVADAACGGASFMSYVALVGDNAELETTEIGWFSFIPGLGALMLAIVTAAHTAGAAVASGWVSSVYGGCSENQPPTCAIVEGVPGLWCGAAVSVAIWLDIGDWFSFEDLDWNKYEAKLADPDYCGGS